MQCFCPITVKNPKVSGKPYIKVPCGKCEACVMNRASQWYSRLLMQFRYSDSATFVTLTYDDDHLPLRLDENGVPVADVSKEDIRHYHARLRRYLGPAKSRKLKYFLISEYGPNPTNGFLNRPHYHAIYFNLQSSDYDVLSFAWKNGFVSFGDCTEGRIRYISGYVTEKLFQPVGVSPVFSFISNGIGSEYIKDYSDFHSGYFDRFYLPLEGQKKVLPRYYKERLYSEVERKVFADSCESRADMAFENDLRRFGNDIHELERRYYDQRSNYVRKLRNKHKKKQNG